MDLDEEYPEDNPWVVDISDTESRVCDTLRWYLRGRIDLEKVLNIVGPIYEETSSPTADQVIKLLWGLADGKFDVKFLRSCFDEMIQNMLQGSLH